MLKNKKKRARLIFLVVGILFIVISSFIDKKFSHSLSKEPSPQVETFLSEPVRVDPSLLEDKSEVNKSIPTRIIIPDLAVDLPVKRSPVVDSYWQVFPDAAGWGEGSAYPQDSNGNQVIFAHAREGLFLPLRNIKNDQNVYIFTHDNWYKYKVKEIKEVIPTNTEVIAATEDKTLTLYTCSGFADSKRLIVVAKPED